MRRLFFSLFLLTYVTISAVIIESNDISKVLEYADRDTLVIFDIDNTLIEPVQSLGNDQWFSYYLKKLIDTGMNPEKALEECVEAWESIRHVTQMQLVEEQAKDVIKKLQNNHICVMGLTTQSLTLSKTTYRHLYHLGIDLTLTSPFHGDVVFYSEKPILYSKGILFTNAGHKGEILKQLLDLIHFQAKKVIFINDKYSHLVPVEEVCEKLDIPFIGIRYGYLDERVKSFNPEIAEKQWDHFGKILSDEEAYKELLSESIEIM